MGSRTAVRVAAALVAAALLQACAAPSGPGGAPGDGASPAGGGRVTECRAGDREVASADQCLLDDSACYEMASGAYCTGPRDSSCPAGSSALPVGEPCPAGARCIVVSESLECVIG